MSNFEKMSQSATRPVKVPNCNPIEQSTCAKHLSPPLGLPAVSLSSSPDWTVVIPKSKKNRAKVKSSDFPVQDARKVLSSSAISEPSKLSYTENPNELASMDNYMSDVTREVVNLSLSALHSVAKGEVEAHPSSVSSSSPTISMENPTHITPISSINHDNLAAAGITYTEYLDLMRTFNHLIENFKVMALTQESLCPGYYKLLNTAAALNSGIVWEEVETVNQSPSCPFTSLPNIPIVSPAPREPSILQSQTELSTSPLDDNGAGEYGCLITTRGTLVSRDATGLLVDQSHQVALVATGEIVILPSSVPLASSGNTLSTMETHDPSLVSNYASVTLTSNPLNLPGKVAPTVASSVVTP